MKKNKKTLAGIGITAIVVLILGIAVIVSITEEGDGSSGGLLSVIKNVFSFESEPNPDGLVATGEAEEKGEEEKPYQEYDYSAIENFEPLRSARTGQTENSSKAEEKEEVLIENGKITCDSFGRFSGQYLEDGTDEPVENIAAILITNQSSEFLEYATLTFDINGKAANFIVTGLPAGRSAWVMEAKRLTIEAGADFKYQDCQSSFRSDTVASTEKIDLTAKGNMMTATNASQETLNNVVVYYRIVHTDGNYLSGVTYTASFDTLEPGGAVETLAGHYSADNCKIVRISWQE